MVVCENKSIMVSGMRKRVWGIGTARTGGSEAGRRGTGKGGGD